MAKRKYTKFTSDELIIKINSLNIELWQKYINGKRQLSDTSKKSYQNDIYQFFIYILMNYDNKYLLDFDAEDASDLIDDYITFCISVLKNSDRRIARRISSISSLYLYYKKKRKIKENPVDLVERPKIEKGKYVQLRTFLTKEQVEMIRLKLIEANDTQLTLFFELGLYTMARVNALSNIKVEQVDLENKEIFGIIEKRGKEVDLCFDDRCKALIVNWLQERKEKGIKSEFLFVSRKGNHSKNSMQTTWIKTIGKFARVKNLHCHDLRHSGSDLRYKAGMSLEEVSEALNHSGTQVTQDFYLQKDKLQLKANLQKYKI